MVEWCRNLLGLKDDAEFLKVLKEIEEDRGAEWRKGGVDVVPFYSGERATGWRGNATGVVANLTRDSTRADFLRANMEGLALRLAAVVEKVRAAGGGAGGVIVASGGALDKNRALREMLADCTGMDVRCLAEGEASSRGVAILVGEALERDAGEGGGGAGRRGSRTARLPGRTRRGRGTTGSRGRSRRGTSGRRRRAACGTRCR